MSNAQKMLLMFVVLAQVGAPALADLPEPTASDIRSAVEAYMSENNFVSGEQLYRERETSPIFFIGYITGLADTGSLMGSSGLGYCTPKGATVGQVADVAFKYLQENPERRHLGASHLVREAFRKAWPCLQRSDISKPPAPGNRRAPPL